VFDSVSACVLVYVVINEKYQVNKNNHNSHTHTHTYTHQRYIVGKVHCGENPCVLGGRCGERTHICTNDTLWGKCIVGKICAS